MHEKIYSTKEAADLLNVTPRTIQLWADSGILSVGKTPGGHRRIKADSVHRLIESMDEIAPPTNPSTAASDTILTVLLVDDDPAFLKMLRTALEQWQLPVNIQTAKDGYEALISIGHFKPQLLITDLNMPGIDGFRMLKIIQESALLENTSICVVTGMAQKQLESESLFNKDIFIIPKPVDLSKLKNFIMDYVATLVQ